MRANWQHFIFALPLFLVGAPSYGARVVEVLEDEPVVLISPEKLNNPVLADKLCFYRRNTDSGKVERITCGAITEIETNQVVVRLSEPAKKPKIGDFAQVIKEKKGPLAAAEEKSVEKAAEKTSPEEKREPAVDKATLPAEAAQVSPQLYAQQKTEKDLNLVRPLAFAILFGTHVGTVYYDYLFDIQLVVHGHVGVGIQPSFGSKKSDTAVTTTWAGGMLTINYYHEPNLRGFWVHGATGVYSLLVSNGSGTETSLSPAFQFALGWRERWAHNLNIGLAFGYQFIASPQRPTIETGFSLAQPVFLGTIGYIF